MILLNIFIDCVDNIFIVLAPKTKQMRNKRNLLGEYFRGPSS